MMNSKLSQNRRLTISRMLLTVMVSGALANTGVASPPPPSEHKGLAVKSLGEIGKSSFSAQLGLSGYKLQLREITIEPGGHIAKHDHATKPGIVKVIKGTWTEGRPEQENAFSANSDGLLEDRDTVHWFFNLGDEPATAYVCDIVPDDS